MPRPKKPASEQTTPVSLRLLNSGVTRVDQIAELRSTDRTEVIKMLLSLGLSSWDRGARPPVKS